MKVAPISFCKANAHSQEMCQKINDLYRKGYNTKQIAEELGCGKSSVRYYYYGVHNCCEAQWHWKNAFEVNKEAGYVQHSLNQVRVGTCVTI